jgi:hypothetical protein
MMITSDNKEYNGGDLIAGSLFETSSSNPNGPVSGDGLTSTVEYLGDIGREGRQGGGR